MLNKRMFTEEFVHFNELFVFSIGLLYDGRDNISKSSPVDKPQETSFLGEDGC